jgi:hypothetical protein
LPYDGDEAHGTDFGEVEGVAEPRDWLGPDVLYHLTDDEGDEDGESKLGENCRQEGIRRGRVEDVELTCMMTWR